MSAWRRFLARYAADAAASSVDGGTASGSDEVKPAGIAHGSVVTGNARGATSASRGSASMTPNGACGDRKTLTTRT